MKKFLKKCLHKLNCLMYLDSSKTKRGTDYPNDCFLVIQRNDFGMGLLSYFITCVGWMGYANRHSMIPVVDLQRFRTIYHPGLHLIRRNVWELFFKQPSRFNVKKIRRAAHLKFVAGIPEDYPSIDMQFFLNENGILDYWRTVVRDQVKVADAVIQEKNDIFESALAEGHVLGVLARGTDYIATKPKAHPVQPTPDEIFRQIENIEVSNGRFEKIYLVTEDGTIVDRFEKKYGSRLILSCQRKLDYNGRGLLFKSNGVVGNIDRGQKYLRAIYDLSRCDYLVMGRTSGSVAAMLFARPKTPAYVFDLGLYK